MSDVTDGNWIRKAVENGLGIKFGRGVVGKTSHAMIVLVVIWGLIVWKLGDNVALNSFLILAGILATGVFCWWTTATQSFAERNPAQAMLDGAEFLEYQRIESEAKGLEAIPGNSVDTFGSLIEGPKP
jgi:hypothetical protein